MDSEVGDIEGPPSQAGELTSLIVLSPVFDDWESFALLLDQLNESLGTREFGVDVLVVSDGSPLPPRPQGLHEKTFSRIRTVEILQLARNLGHQRAIAIGLSHIRKTRPCEAVIVMDADGEDNPRDVPRLIDALRAYGHEKIVFARRVRRSEPLAFRIFYNIFRQVYRLLTGFRIQHGNFSIVPYALLARLVIISEIWNHYAAGVMKAKIPFAELSTERGKRLAGRSRMSFVSLVMHGLGAISVHNDTIGIRVLIAMFVVIAASLTGITVVVVIRTFTDLAIPGWATFVTLSFIIVLMQATTVTLFFVFNVLHDRRNSGFIPLRDYEQFVLHVEKIYPREARA